MCVPPWCSPDPQAAGTAEGNVVLSVCMVGPPSVSLVGPGEVMRSSSSAGAVAQPDANNVLAKNRNSNWSPGVEQPTV